MQKNPDCLIIEGIFLGDPQKTGADESKSGDGARMRSHAISPKTLRGDDFEAFFQMRANNLLTPIGKAMGKSLSFESFEDFAGHSDNGKSKEYKVHPEIINNY